LKDKGLVPSEHSSGAVVCLCGRLSAGNWRLCTGSPARPCSPIRGRF